VLSYLGLQSELGLHCGIFLWHLLKRAAELPNLVCGGDYPQA